MAIKANRDFWNKLQRICAEHGPRNGNPNSRAPHAVESMESFLEMLKKG